MNIAPGEVRRRGDVLESVYHDTTRAGHPPAASVFDLGGRHIVVPVDPERPVIERESHGSAVEVIARMIKGEQ